MKTIVKLAMVVGVVLAMTGCENQSKVSDNEQTRNQSYTRIAPDMYVFCDKAKGIEYMVYDGHKAGGITVRMNTVDSVSTCH